MLSDPTFDPPGRRYSFGWGAGSTKTVGPAVPADGLPPLDVVLVTHDQHGDNLDTAGRSAPARRPARVATTQAEPAGSDCRTCVAWRRGRARRVSAPGRPDLDDHGDALLGTGRR